MPAGETGRRGVMMAQGALEARPGREGSRAVARGVSVVKKEERHASSGPQAPVPHIGEGPLTEARERSRVRRTVPVDPSLGPTIGRESALAQLDAALDASSETTTCVALEGEPGIGKTHL